jgi:uncharacterized membrane protein YedE/YeeE
MELLEGLLIGVLFGAALVASGLTDTRRLIGMLTLKDLYLLRVMVTALVVGAVGVALLDGGGLAHLKIKPLSVGANLVGGALFGVGWGLSGYCPGTLLAASVEGRRDAPFTLLGALAGTGLFALVFPWMDAWLIRPLSYGPVTLPGLVHLPRLVVALVLGAVGAGFIAWWIVQSRRARGPRSDAAGGVVHGRGLRPRPSGSAS